MLTLAKWLIYYSRYYFNGYLTVLNKSKSIVSKYAFPLSYGTRSGAPTAATGTGSGGSPGSGGSAGGGGGGLPSKIGNVIISLAIVNYYVLLLVKYYMRFAPPA